MRNFRKLKKFKPSKKFKIVVLKPTIRNYDTIIDYRAIECGCRTCDRLGYLSHP